MAAAIVWSSVCAIKADDIQVNTYTSGNQFAPSVSLDATGNFVVVWHSDGSGGNDQSTLSIQGQRYDFDGFPADGEFQVNTYTTSYQLYPSVGLDADGNFVVVWASNGSSKSDTDLFSIQGRRYTSNGSALGDQFQVNTSTSDNQIQPWVSLDADGDFVVVWASQDSNGTDSSSYSIQGQRYASDGSTLGSEFQVNTFTPDRQLLPSVSLDADGDFVVVWASYGSSGSDSSSFSIQGQRFDSNGDPLGGEFQVNTYTMRIQFRPKIDLDADGDFVVVWDSLGSSNSDLSDLSIQGRRYGSDGSPFGSDFQVNTNTVGDQLRPSISLEPDGDFVVVWQSNGPDSIQGQRYSSDGATLGQEFQVNTCPVNSQQRPSVSTSGGENFVVAWDSPFSSDTDTYGRSVQGAIPRTISNSIFEDDFELGDTSAWSQTVDCDGCPQNMRPEVEIISPEDGEIFPDGTGIEFVGMADDEDGDLSPGLRWDSDLDGFLGSGRTIFAELSEGDHEITASVFDSGYLEGSATIMVTVISCAEPDIKINFDLLTPGPLAADEFPEANFVSDPEIPIQVVALPKAPSPPNVICTDAIEDCNNSIFIDFTDPAYCLTFKGVGSKNDSQVAEVRVLHIGGETTVPIVGENNGQDPISVDLKEFRGVSRIEIKDILDPAGIAWDDFHFEPIPPGGWN